MFRLQSSGLPKDPMFPSDLKSLGYFINDEDQIRNIESPNTYFKFFLTKNDRYNAVQREAMNDVIRSIVIDRLHALALNTVRLPLGTAASEPHIPILVSDNLHTKSRIIILFYEHLQDLGIFAQRIIGSHGGINAGSAVNFVKAIQALRCSPDNEAPGIILANLGQLRWYRKGKKAVTQMSWYAMPRKTAVSDAPRFDPLKNTVPGNRSTVEHVDYIFNEVVMKLAHPEAKLDVIGVSDGACNATEFLNKEDNWMKWEKRMEALALLAPFYHRSEITNPHFAAWLRKRGRAYVVSGLPAKTPIAGPDGNRFSQAYGCATYSLGEEFYTELMLVKGHATVLEWFQEVASDPGYVNEEVVVFEDGEDDGKVES